MNTISSSILWGVAGDNLATCSCERLIAFTKSKWHYEAGAIGLKHALFHHSAMASKQ